RVARIAVLTSVVALSIGFNDPAHAQARRGSVDVDWSVLDDLSSQRPRAARPQGARPVRRPAQARPQAARPANTQQTLDRLAEAIAAQTAELQRIRDSVAAVQASELDQLREQVRRQGEEIEQLRVSGRVRNDQPTTTGEAPSTPARPRTTRGRDYTIVPP